MAKNKSKAAAKEPTESKPRTRVVKFKPITKLLTNNLAILDEQIRKSERVNNIYHFIEILHKHILTKGIDEGSNISLPEFIESAMQSVQFFKTDKDTILELAEINGLKSATVRSTSETTYLLKASIDEKEQSFWVKKIAFEHYQYGIDNYTIGNLGNREKNEKEE